MIHTIIQITLFLCSPRATSHSCCYTVQASNTHMFSFTSTLNHLEDNRLCVTPHTHSQGSVYRATSRHTSSDTWILRVISVVPHSVDTQQAKCQVFTLDGPPASPTVLHTPMRDQNSPSHGTANSLPGRKSVRMLPQPTVGLPYVRSQRSTPVLII